MVPLRPICVSVPSWGKLMSLALMFIALKGYINNLKWKNGVRP